MTQNQYIKLGRWLTLSGYFSLLFGLFTWHLLIDHTAKHLISIIVLAQIGPLMFPLMGLLKGKLYTHAWSMYMAIFYFIVGVWYAGSSEDLMIGLYVIFTSLVFFLGTVLYTRFMGKKMKEMRSSSE
ncbi:MAG: DUF2069 domain-containing protein [Gammaproteobacteria bacterium]|nr:DUF2069 domain-containing protein [Gammaproteobacteria bacterium]MCK4833227.1 DUF2069 domain-containing protein [Gammaproteobacteria bacterium]